MIYSVNGKLIYKDNAFAVVECGGVGMKCAISLKTSAALPNINENVFLLTYMQVREDAIDLFGFIDKAELETFKLLISINGVGAKAALSILSFYSPDKVLLFIATGDSKALTAASGIGAKIASRIVLELKDKVGTIDVANADVATAVNLNNTATSATKDAVDALMTFGFNASEASLAVSKCDPTLPVDEIIKHALKLLSKRV